jgi:hypothetical protein
MIAFQNAARVLASLAAASVALLGCSLETQVASEGSAEQAATVARSVYFRCNSTSWDPTDASRLKPSTSNPSQLELTFEVKERYMVEFGGDSCIFTETAALNGWGDWHQHLSVNGAVRAPGTGYAPGTPASSNFAVQYEKLGRYRIVASSVMGGYTFNISAATTGTPVPAPLFFAYPLSTFAEQFVYRYSNPNHPNTIRLDVKQGLPLLGSTHYGIKLNERYMRVGGENYEFDVETGTLYQDASQGGPLVVKRLLPPSLGGNKTEYVTALQALRTKTDWVAKGLVNMYFSNPPHPELEETVAYLDAVIAQVNP